MRYLVGMLVALSLVGCGAPAETTAPDSAPSISKSDLYLNTVRDEYPELESVDDSLLITYAKNTCDLLENGASGTDIFNAVLESGIDVEVGAYITGAGVQAYCPEYSDELLDLGSPT